MKILEKYFVYFGDKSARNKIPNNARVSMEIVHYLLQESNESSLKRGLLSIYDEICKVKQPYTKSDKKAKAKKKDKKLENKENDILLETTKIKNTNIPFTKKFKYYFDELTQKENVNCDLKTFLAIILVEVGIFLEIKEDISGVSYDHDSNNTLKQQLKTQMKEYIDLGLLNVAICDDLQYSLFHEFVTLDSSEMLTMLLTLDNDLSKYHSIDGTTPIDVAMKSGQWSHVQQIALAKMGQKMKDKARTEEKNIETKRGIVNTFLRQRKKMMNDGKEKSEKKNEKKEREIEKEQKSDIDDDGKDESKGDERKDGVEFEMVEDELLEDLLNTMLNLIEKQAPISDDMLLLCWKYEMNKMKHKPNHLKNRLWIVLKKVILNVLSDTKNKQKWIWFKQNLLSSVIWYEVVLFDSSDSVLLGAINAVGDNGLSSKNNETKSKSSRGKLFCECGTQFELGLPSQVFGRKHFECASCSQYHWSNPRFYHCPNSSANGHPPTQMCTKCAEKQRKQNVAQSATATITAKPNNTKQKAVAATNKQEEFILYAELFGMANDKLTQEKLKLKEKIDKISSKQAWKSMANKQLAKNEQVDSNELRQDSSELLTFPNGLGFDFKKLQRLGLKDFYDVKIYLPQLLVVANALNDKFHDTLKNDILKKDMTVLYTRGPLKRIERCQTKGRLIVLFVCLFVS